MLSLDALRLYLRMIAVPSEIADPGEEARLDVVLRFAANNLWKD